MKYLKYITLSFLLIFLALLFLPSNSVKAVVSNPNEFNDGGSNWAQLGQTNAATTQNANIPISSSLNLGYGFGAAQNTSGKVVTGGLDSDFLKMPLDIMSTGYQANFFPGGRMNVFLNNNSNYISTTFQGKSTSQSDVNQQSGWSSPDFLLTPSGYSGSMSQKDFSILGYPASTNGSSNVGLENKTFWVGNYDGKTAYRILGQFTRKASSSTGNQAYNLDVELLLRPSPTNSAIVQRELYVYNPSASSQKFQIYFGEDTALGTAMGSNDHVPVRSIGDGSGLYISNSVDPTDASRKLFITNDTVDGFSDFTGLNLSNGINGNASNNPNWLWKFNNGGGQKDSSANDNLIATSSNPTASGDTGYLLKWPSTTLATGQVAHYSSTIGATISPYAFPIAEKTYTNETRSDGTNRVGDKLKFSLKMKNDGINSTFNLNDIKDEIPAGLQIDPNSFKKIITTVTNGNSSSSTTDVSSSDAYNSTDNTVEFSPGYQLKDNQKYTLTFEATITNDASGKTLTNTGLFYGYDPNAYNTNQKYQDSVNIPVENSKFGYTFTKQIKKSTDTDYSSSVKGSAGDQVDYKIDYNVLSGSNYTSSLANGATITDTLPDGLHLKANSVNYTNGSGTQTITNGNSLSNLALGTISPGQTGTLTFSAIIDKSTAGTIDNHATVNNAKTSLGTSLGDMTSSIATINVQDSESFLSVPNIDFGSVNMDGKERTVSNVISNGGLRVAHPNSNNYSIKVSYNNLASGKMVNNNGDSLSNSSLDSNGNGLLYIKQRTSSPNDAGKFVPILSTGTPIQTDEFAGGSSDTNLSGYVGVGDWQIKLGSNTKNGAYKGTLTWSINDSIANK